MKPTFSRQFAHPIALSMVGSLSITTFAVPLTARAQTTDAPPIATAVAPPKVAIIDAQSQQLMAQTFRTYRALNSYSSTVSWQESGVPRPESGSGRVTWQKPNRVVVQTERLLNGGSGKLDAAGQMNIFDGAKLISARTRPTARADEMHTRYVSQKLENSAQGLQQAIEPIAVSGIGVSAFLSGRSPLQVMSGQFQRVRTRKVSPEEARGLDENAGELDAVEATLTPRESSNSNAANDLSATFIIARADHLLRRVSVAIGSGAKQQTLTETYRKVRVNPELNALTFTYAPPLQARRVAQFAEGYDERLEIGSAPFPIQTTALDGKNLSLNGFKNRVVLLDFWATWCPPCRDEMPNVVAVYNKLHRRGFDIVGISLDENKGALQKYTAQNKMPWRQIFDGKGWNSSIAAQFGVTAIPFTLLIGRDGKIAAINPRGAQLEAAVKTALRKSP